MSAPSDTQYAAETVDADEAYAELSRQLGLAMGQIVQMRMLLDKRGGRIIELEAAVRDAQPAQPAADTD